MTKRWVLSLAGCMILALVSTSAYGQAVFGNIVGTATDPQGAAVRRCHGDCDQCDQEYLGHGHDE